jgi:hypothetical protein
MLHQIVVLLHNIINFNFELTKLQH